MSGTNNDNDIIIDEATRLKMAAEIAELNRDFTNLYEEQQRKEEWARRLEEPKKKWEEI